MLALTYEEIQFYFKLQSSELRNPVQLLPLFHQLPKGKLLQSILTCLYLLSQGKGGHMPNRFCTLMFSIGKRTPEFLQSWKAKFNI